MAKDIDALKKKVVKLEKRIAHLEKKCGNCRKEDTDDVVLPKAIKLVRQYDMVSASLLQRTFEMGYARAARLLDQLEEKGIVGKGEGSKPRKVLVKK